MADIIMAVDLGSSLSRAIYCTSSSYFKPKLIFLSPEVIQVSEKNIENYEQYNIVETKLEDSLWLKWSQSYFAVGSLAKKNFNSLQSLQLVKIDCFITRTLALVGCLAQKYELSSHFSISLGILLPWNQLHKRERFNAQLSEALANYIFRGQSLSVQLESCIVLPKGGGIFVRGRIPPPLEEKPINPKEINIAVIMLGYHHSSILLIEKGVLTKGVTENFGLVRMIEELQILMPNHSLDVLIPVICQARNKLGDRILEVLANSTKQGRREIETAKIAQKIAEVREKYVHLLNDWLFQHLTSQTPIDEFIISGGTSLYLKPELITLLKPFNSVINWCDSLEIRILKTFGHTVSDHSLECRLADVYGLFCKQLNSSPLPRLKENFGDFNNVQNRAS